MRLFYCIFRQKNARYLKPIFTIADTFPIYLISVMFKAKIPSEPVNFPHLWIELEVLSILICLFLIIPI